MSDEAVLRRFFSVVLRASSGDDEQGVDLSRFARVREAVCTYEALCRIATTRHLVHAPMLTADALHATEAAERAFAWASPRETLPSRRIAVLVSWVLQGAAPGHVQALRNNLVPFLLAAFKAGNGPPVAAVALHFLPPADARRALAAPGASAVPGLIRIISAATERHGSCNALLGRGC